VKDYFLDTCLLANSHGVPLCNLEQTESQGRRPDLTHSRTAGCLRPYEAGRAYVMPRAVAHAAAKRDFVARERPPRWSPPSMFRLPETLTEAEVVAAEAKLKALQRHALELVDPKAEMSVLLSSC
jgi:hypothetical protein